MITKTDISKLQHGVSFQNSPRILSFLVLSIKDGLMQQMPHLLFKHFGKHNTTHRGEFFLEYGF